MADEVNKVSEGLAFKDHTDTDPELRHSNGLVCKPVEEQLIPSTSLLIGQCQWAGLVSHLWLVGQCQWAWSESNLWFVGKCQWAGLTGVEGAAGTLRRVKHAAYICGAGGGGGRGWSQWGAGWIGGGGSPTVSLTVRDAAVTNLPGLILQWCWMSHGARPWRGWTDSRGLQSTVVLLYLDVGGGGGGGVRFKHSGCESLQRNSFIQKFFKGFTQNAT